MTVRDDIVAEARSWLGTPYRHSADIKGAGVDCAMLIVRVYADLGLIDLFDPRPYTTDWHLHRNEELYLENTMSHCNEVAEPEPGDLIVWQHGRTFSHGGICTGWPTVVHAYQPSGIVEEVSILNTPLMYRGLDFRPVKFYCLKRLSA